MKKETKHERNRTYKGVILPLIIYGIFSISMMIGCGYDTRTETGTEANMPLDDTNSDDSNKILDTAWGPEDRETFSWDNRTDHVVFNSITDNPYLGDERNFVRIRKVGDKEETDEVELEDGQEYQVTIYYHNNADSALNESGAGISRNTYVRAQFPSYLNKGEIGVISGFISASNANPVEIWDSCYARAKENVHLSFDPNTCIIHNEGTVNGTVLSGDALLSDNGVTIGHYDNMWGMIPAGTEYGGYITFLIKVEKASFEVKSEVSIDGENWDNQVYAQPRDVVYFRLALKNTGTKELEGVTAHDDLCDGMSYVEGSTYAYSSRHPEGGDSPDSISKDGLGLGAAVPNEEIVVTYQALLGNDVKHGDILRNSSYYATTSGTVYENATIIIK